MSHSIIVVGIDISKEKFDIHLLPSGQKAVFDNSEKGVRSLIDLLRKQTCESRCLMEATGNYHRLCASMLVEAGFFTAVVNPRQSRNFALSMGWLVKTDEIDAWMLAEFAKLEHIRPIEKAPQNALLLNDLTTRRRQFTAMLAVEKTRLQEPLHPEVLKTLERNIKSLEKQRDQLDKRINELIESDDDWRNRREILSSVPGIGQGIATQLVSDIPELGEMNRQEAAMIAGVAPVNRDSGKMRGKQCIQGGRSCVRAALYMAALTAYRCNTVIRTFAKRLESKGKPFKVVIVACMRKLLTILNLMVKNNQTWRPDVQKTLDF
jgi:transposase